MQCYAICYVVMPDRRGLRGASSSDGTATAAAMCPVRRARGVQRGGVRSTAPVGGCDALGGERPAPCCLQQPGHRLQVSHVQQLADPRGAVDARVPTLVGRSGRAVGHYEEVLGACNAAAQEDASVVREDAMLVLRRSDASSPSRGVLVPHDGRELGQRRRGPPHQLLTA